MRGVELGNKKIVLAYSGGLDTSIMITWLKETYGYDVVAMCANLGQAEELDGLEEKALATGASAVYIEDCREEFITDYIYPCLQAGAIYERDYLLGTSFGRPLIAKKMVEIAHKEGATAVSHGATGKGNDQVRFELTFMALDPTLTIVAPWKDPKWTLHSREDCIAYADAHNIPIEQSKGRIYSEDRNIWHISHEGGSLEDPENAPKDDVYTISKTLEEAADKADVIILEFRQGVPIRINGTVSDPVNLLTQLNEYGAKHGIGQIDMVENRLVGMKSRGVYETPGGTILYKAHQLLEQLVLDRDTLRVKQTLAIDYAQLVYDGRWFSSLRQSLDAFVTETQQNLTGTVSVKLYKGNIVPAGMSSPHSLYVDDLASFSDTELYNQQDAKGFINIYGLPLKIKGMNDRDN
ncbi:MAG: argininosuccinate synthase [Rickettsiales bacterium]|nr:argininosuccinate synthase [Rickettsiales bacterium]